MRWIILFLFYYPTLLRFKTKFSIFFKMSFKIIQRKDLKADNILFYYERLFIRSKLILSISYVKTWIILPYFLSIVVIGKAPIYV
jgi:hypothetical protein